MKPVQAGFISGRTTFFIYGYLPPPCLRQNRFSEIAFNYILPIIC